MLASASEGDAAVEGSKDLRCSMVLPKALVWRLAATVGCTSCRGGTATSVAASKAACWAGPGLLLMLASKLGGPMDAAFWSMVLSPISDCVSDSATDEAPSTLLDFLDSWSRGSSWHRWPIFRLIHLLHGLSCSPAAR